MYYLIFCFIIVAASAKRVPQANSVKISMVTSLNSRQTPAIFRHAESPVWDTNSQRLYFVDALAQNVHWLDYNSGNISTKHIDYGQVNVISLVTGTDRLLVAVRAALYLLDPNVSGDEALRLVTSLDEGLPDNLINEGKADALGRFWVGTKGPQVGDVVTSDKATFYSVSQENFFRPNVKLRPVSISNGITWSLNNTVFYYIDSPTRKIEAFDFDLQTGDIAGRRTILDIEEYGYDEAIPDGMTIDSEGHLWVAIMFGGTVLHIDPDQRSIVFEYKLPTERVTSLCWGGPLLDELFVTSGRESDNDTDPLAGAIFTIQGTGSFGLPLYNLRFDNADSY